MPLSHSLRFLAAQLPPADDRTSALLVIAASGPTESDYRRALRSLLGWPPDRIDAAVLGALAAPCRWVEPVAPDHHHRAPVLLADSVERLERAGVMVSAVDQWCGRALYSLTLPDGATAERSGETWALPGGMRLGVRRGDEAEPGTAMLLRAYPVRRRAAGFM